MKIRQAVFLVALLGLLPFVTGCDNNGASAQKKEPATYSQGTRLPTGSQWKAGVAVTIGDVDGDGVLDIVIAVPEGIKIVKNPIPQKK